MESKQEDIIEKGLDRKSSDSSNEGLKEELSRYAWDHIEGNTSQDLAAKSDAKTDELTSESLEFNAKDLYSTQDGPATKLEKTEPADSATSEEALGAALLSLRYQGDLFTTSERYESTGIKTTRVANEAVTQERRHLRELLQGAGRKVEENIVRDSILPNFENDMASFERRARNAGLSPSEIANTYHHISRLLEAGPNSPGLHSYDDRIRLAGGLLHHAADPTSVRQGVFNTCTVAAIEARIYTRNPSAAAQLVADVAITGQYTTHNGTRVEIDSDSLQRIPLGARSHANQIFQVAATNVHYRTTGDNRRYVQRNIVDANQDGQVDPQGTGEHLLDGTGRIIPGIHEPNLTLEQLDDISNQITGANERGFLIRSGSASSDAGVVNVENAEDLHNTLVRMQRDGIFPAVLRVHTGQEPFKTDSTLGGGGAGGSEGRWHGVTITGYDPRTRSVSVDNQWFDSQDRLTGDRRIPVAQLFQATRAPGFVDRMISRISDYLP